MVCNEEFPVIENNRHSLSRRYTWVILLIILSLAAFTRLANIGSCPPGLYQDEAANAWSAYCILKTGKDYAGVSWPIYYVRNLGGNSPTLYVYLLLPFQALGGMNVYTTRLPAAIGSIFTIWLIYFVAKRLFNTETGLAAAAFLTVNPWHHQQIRWGSEASISPLLGLAPLALMLWAGMPISDNKTITPRPVIAALGGALSGIGCFGYMSVRLFVPAFLFTAVLLTLPQWWRTLKTRKGAQTIAAFLIAFAATFGQLAYLHIFHPEGIGRHALYKSPWVGSAGLSESLKNIPLRYVKHFNPYFLFIESDTLLSKLSPSNESLFHLYMLPLMAVGLVTLFRKFKLSPSARIILAFVLAYPIGDCVIWGMPLNTVRCTPGLCSLVLLAAVGAVSCINWLRRQNYKLALGIAAIFVFLVIGSITRSFYRYYVEFPRTPDVYHYFHTDIVEACKWLKPRFDDFDAVFCTAEKGMDMSYVVTIVALGYDPKQWFSEPREITTVGEWDYYIRYGKMYFMHENLFTPPDKKFHAGRVLLIIRPGEVDLPDPNKQIIRKISRPDGTVTLWLCRL